MLPREDDGPHAVGADHRKSPGSHRRKSRVKASHMEQNFSPQWFSITEVGGLVRGENVPAVISVIVELSLAIVGPLF